MKSFFWISALIVITGAATLPFFMAPPPLYWFEGGLALLFISIILLYLRIIKPISAIRTGVSLLNEQDFSSRLSNVGQRDADSIAATFNRMIDTLKNERLRIMEQNHFLDMLIDASPAGILILNFDGTIRTANPAACAMLGEKELVGNKLEELKGDLSHALPGLKNGSSITVRLSDTHIYRCSRLCFIDTGFQRPFIMIESLSKEIMKAEREAYGKVIRLIGHEVNNTVAGLVPMFETIEMVSEDADLREASASCRERCDSLSSFITRYAEVVKLPAPVLRSTNLSLLFASLMPFLESLTAGRDITISLESEQPAIAKIDPVQMEQVIVNVIKNSIESIGRIGSITIRINASPVGFEITDNGAGISPEAADNMFSPFFSTKEGGQGIGLTLVSEILRSHGCTFSLRTSPLDRLTRFSARFP